MSGASPARPRLEVTIPGYDPGSFLGWVGRPSSTRAAKTSLRYAHLPRVSSTCAAARSSRSKSSAVKANVTRSVRFFVRTRARTLDLFAFAIPRVPGLYHADFASQSSCSISRLWSATGTSMDCIGTPHRMFSCFAHNRNRREEASRLRAGKMIRNRQVSCCRHQGDCFNVATAREPSTRVERGSKGRGPDDGGRRSHTRRAREMGRSAMGEPVCSAGGLRFVMFGAIGSAWSEDAANFIVAYVGRDQRGRTWAWIAGQSREWHLVKGYASEPADAAVLFNDTVWGEEKSRGRSSRHAP